MTDGEVDWDSDAPEELTSQQGTQQYEEIRKIQTENKARVFREGKVRRKKLAQKLTSKPLQKGQESSDKAIMETHEESHDNKGMLPDDIVKLLAAREKIVFTSDSEDEKSEKKAASRKRRTKKSGLEPVILNDMPLAQCVQNSLDFLKKRKMQVSRSCAVLVKVGYQGNDCQLDIYSMCYVRLFIFIILYLMKLYFSETL